MEGAWQGVLREHVSQENETDFRFRSLVPDPIKFPRGMRYIADQLHALGLQLGVYTDIGTHTCQGFPGSYGHWQQDTDTFAGWGVDAVKVRGRGGGIDAVKVGAAKPFTRDKL